jgi:hypothetical protein
LSDGQASGRASAARLYPAGTLTVALGGASRLATFVQHEPYYTAQNVAVLAAKKPMTLQEKLYWAMCIKANRFRYEGFGREANRTLATLELPGQVPKWAMSTEMPSLKAVMSATAAHVDLASPKGWADFRFDELFDVKKGRRLTKADRQPGPNRFIGASEKRNGVTDLVSAAPEFGGGVLTVAYNGNSVGWAFFQDAPFLASDDVNVLVPIHEIPKFALLFVAAVIKHGKSRYTYGYKWNQERMKRSTIRLPVSHGRPDWSYMEKYMRGLAFSSGADGGVSDELKKMAVA